MNQKRLPSVIHFVSDGKPWVVLMYEYQPSLQPQVDPSTFRMLGKQAVAHLLWRAAFFKATGTPPSDNSFLIRAALAAGGQVEGEGSIVSRNTGRKRHRLRQGGSSRGTRKRRRKKTSRRNKLIRKLRERRKKKMEEL